MSSLRRLALALCAAPLALGLAACGSSDEGGANAEVVAPVAAPAGQQWADVVAITPEGGWLSGNPKAPIRLVHFPGVALAVVAAALILALTATSGRLFLASAGDAAVGQELDRIGGIPMLAMARLRALVVRCSICDDDADSLRRSTAGMGTGSDAICSSKRTTSWTAASATSSASEGSATSRSAICGTTAAR